MSGWIDAFWQKNVDVFVLILKKEKSQVQAWLLRQFQAVHKRKLIAYTAMAQKLTCFI